MGCSDHVYSCPLPPWYSWGTPAGSRGTKETKTWNIQVSSGFHFTPINRLKQNKFLSPILSIKVWNNVNNPLKVLDFCQFWLDYAAIMFRLSHSAAILFRLSHPVAIMFRLSHPAAILFRLSHPAAILFRLSHPAAILLDYPTVQQFCLDYLTLQQFCLDYPTLRQFCLDYPTLQQNYV